MQFGERRQAYIQGRLDRVFKKYEITHDRITGELARIAFSNMRDFVDWGPDGVNLRPDAALAQEEAACIAEVCETETTAGRTVRFKLHSKVAALELLGRDLGMWRGEGDRDKIRAYVLIDDLDEVLPPGPAS